MWKSVIKTIKKFQINLSQGRIERVIVVRDLTYLLSYSLNPFFDIQNIQKFLFCDTVFYNLFV